jgi:hypothetical protein
MSGQKQDDLLDDLFTGCALAAFLDQAHIEQRWPSREATRRRATAYYEEELALKNCRPCKPPSANRAPPAVARCVVGADS